MKNLITTLLFSLCVCALFAQAPKGINYQAVARKTNGEPITNASVNVQFRILNGGVFGTEVYRESHTTTTNVFGLFTLKIGGGSALSGTFAGINWSNGAKFLEVTVQSSFGTVTGGATEMLSVPFALYAAAAPAALTQVGIEQSISTSFPSTLRGSSWNDVRLNNTENTILQLQVPATGLYLILSNGTKINGCKALNLLPKRWQQYGK